MDGALTWHTHKGHSPLHKLYFNSDLIRTLVVMATYIFSKIIMGKMEVDNMF